MLSESFSGEPKRWISPAGTRIDSPTAPAGNVRRSFSALDQLDAIAVGIAHEAESRAALAHGVRRFLGLDALLRELGQNLVQVGHGDRNVVVPRPELVGIHAV